MDIVNSSAIAATSIRRSHFIVDQPPCAIDWPSPVSALFFEPDVFHAKIVDDAVDHHRPALDPRLPAIGEAVEKDDRPRPVLGQLLFNLPHQLLALPLVGFR